MINPYQRYQIDKVLKEVREATSQKRKVIDLDLERKVRYFIKEKLLNPKKEKSETDKIIEQILIKAKGE